MKKICNILCGLFTGFFICLTILCALFFTKTVRKEVFYDFIKETNLSAKLNISENDLERGAAALCEYVTGTGDHKDDPNTHYMKAGTVYNFYNDEELKHLYDVKLLFSEFKIYGLVFGILSAFGVFILIFTGKRKLLGKTLIISTTAGSVLLLALIYRLYAKTYSTVILLHKILFPNGNFLFTENTSVLVNFFSEEFYLKAGWILIKYTALSYMILLITGVMLILIQKRVEK